MKIRVELTDTFSGATDIKFIDHSQETMFKLRDAKKNKSVVSIFDKQAQIRYDWIITKFRLALPTDLKVEQKKQVGL